MHDFRRATRLLEVMAEKIISPSEAMSLAISEAKKGHGWVSPNPVVGCVILDSAGHLLSQGYHKKVGGPHAEIEALRAIQDQTQLNGAQVFVTLEPCSHHGRTPPCADALSRLPLKEVTFGLLDPNPKVSGRGAAMLRAVGIKCTEWPAGAIKDELNELAEIFLYNQREQKTFVSLKIATSLDGRMGLKGGESKWITGEEAREFSHLLRAQYDVVIIGKRTFLEDDPSLNVRLEGFEAHQNAVVIVDPRGECISKIANSNLAKVRPLNKIFIATLDGPSTAEGVQLLRVQKNATGKMDIEHLLSLLWQNELKSVFVEGGAHTFAGFLESRLIQRLHLFLAPNLIGGAFGISWTEHFGKEKLSDRLEFEKLSPVHLGRDLYLSLNLSK